MQFMYKCTRTTWKWYG